MAVWAFGGVGVFDSVEDLVQGDVACSKLGEEASLVSFELRDNVEIVVGW